MFFFLRRLGFVFYPSGAAVWAQMADDEIPRALCGGEEGDEEPTNRINEVGG